MLYEEWLAWDRLWLLVVTGLWLLVALPAGLLWIAGLIWKAGLLDDVRFPPVLLKVIFFEIG